MTAALETMEPTKSAPRRANARGHDTGRLVPIQDESSGPRTCRCGCGETPPPAPRTIARRGHVKGQPMPWCPGHYHRRDPERQFRKWVGEPDDHGCWPWQGTIAGNGYGRFAIRGGSIAAHRFSYELLVGPVPEGLELDHLCRNRACVNPAHLEPVTHRANTLRGDTLTAANARKTHCIHGHKFTAENTYTQWGGGRGCRACRDRANRERSR